MVRGCQRSAQQRSVQWTICRSVCFCGTRAACQSARLRLWLSLVPDLCMHGPSQHQSQCTCLSDPACRPDASKSAMQHSTTSLPNLRMRAAHPKHVCCCCAGNSSQDVAASLQLMEASLHSTLTGQPCMPSFSHHTMAVLWLGTVDTHTVYSCEGINPTIHSPKFGTTVFER